MEVCHSDTSIIWVDTNEGISLRMSTEKARELCLKLKEVLEGIGVIQKDQVIKAFKAGRLSAMDNVDFNTAWVRFLKESEVE